MSYHYGSLDVILLDDAGREVARRPARFYVTSSTPGHVVFEADAVTFSGLVGRVTYAAIEHDTGLCCPLTLAGGPYDLRGHSLDLGPLRFHQYAAPTVPREPVPPTTVILR